MPDTVLLHVSERIATLTLNRPAARNAMSSELLTTLQATLADVDGRDDVDVIILTGADPAFCAGLDLKELGSTASAGGDHVGQMAVQRPGHHRRVRAGPGL
jgi:enoyl-CoA hydratase